MVKIRLMRIGAKKRPFYRVVAVDERSKRTGAYVELLGTYNPLTEPKDIKLKQDRIDYWVKQGAQMSDGFLRIIGKAPQRPPRKPKKTREQVKKEEPPVVSDQTTDQKDSEKSENQNKSETSKPESQKEDISESTEQTDTPISSGTPSLSESSEKEEESTNERPA